VRGFNWASDIWPDYLSRRREAQPGIQVTLVPYLLESTLHRRVIITKKSASHTPDFAPGIRNSEHYVFFAQLSPNPRCEGIPSPAKAMLEGSGAAIKKPLISPPPAERCMDIPISTPFVESCEHCGFGAAGVPPLAVI
jgi:hypothetical protein